MFSKLVMLDFFSSGQVCCQAGKDMIKVVL